MAEGHENTERPEPEHQRFVAPQYTADVVGDRLAFAQRVLSSRRVKSSLKRRVGDRRAVPDAPHILGAGHPKCGVSYDRAGAAPLEGQVVEHRVWLIPGRPDQSARRDLHVVGELYRGGGRPHEPLAEYELDSPGLQACSRIVAEPGIEFGKNAIARVDENEPDVAPGASRAGTMDDSSPDVDLDLDAAEQEAATATATAASAVGTIEQP